MEPCERAPAAPVAGVRGPALSAAPDRLRHGRGWVQRAHSKLHIAIPSELLRSIQCLNSTQSEQKRQGATRILMMSLEHPTC
eukprot:94820-Amphidinium_carterae.1